MNSFIDRIINQPRQHSLPHFLESTLLSYTLMISMVPNMPIQNQLTLIPRKKISSLQSIDESQTYPTPPII